MRRVIERMLGRELTNVAYHKVLHSCNYSRDSDVRYGEFLFRFGGRVAEARKKTKPAEPKAKAAALGVNGDGGARQKPAGIDGKINSTLAKSVDQVKAAMRGRDWQGRGTLPAAEFLKVLRDFNVKLSTEDGLWLAKQWAARADGTGPVRWMDFLRHYSRRKGGEVAKLAARTTRAARQRDGPGMRPAEDMALGKIRTKVLPHWTAIRRACLKLDPKPVRGARRSGYIPAAEFRKILKSFGIVCDAETFYQIHSVVDRELRKGVKYDAFFQEILKQR